MSGCLVVANAPWRWSEPHVELVRTASLVVAADGGANHLARIGVRPAAVVGDLDSIRPGVRRWIGEERMVFRPDQDETDLHKTLTYAFDERGEHEMTVLAALDGRADHALANLGLLAQWSRRCTLCFLTPGLRIVAVTDHAQLASTPGQTVSLMPVGHCERVWTTGLHWPLVGEPLDLLGRHGVSNRAIAERIDVRVEGGVLLAFLSQPD
jgi:thiamine pyrophosphokinase